MGTGKKIPNEAPDGGFGWVILAICSVNMFLINSSGKISGIIFSAIIEEYRGTRTQVTLIFVMCRMFGFGTAPVAGKLLEKYSYKTVLSIGALMMCSGVILTSFCTEIWQIVITYGVLLGSGGGLLISSSIVIIGLYFKKRKSLAYGIYFSVGGCGAFLMPIIFEYFMEEYGYYGAMLIFGGIMSHPCAFSMLIRQPVWITNVSDKKQKVPLIENKTADQNDVAIHLKNGNLQDTNSLTNGKSSDDHRTRNSFLRTITNFMSGVIEDLRLFKNVTYICLLISRVGTAFPIFMFLSYVPDYLKHNFKADMSDKDIAYVLSMSSIGDIVSRFIMGTLLEKFPWRKKYTVGGLGILSSVILCTFQLAQTYTMVFVFIIIYGLLAGNYLVSHMVLMTELVQPQKLAIIHGFLQFCLGVTMMIGGMITSYIRDVTGSYEIGFYIFSGSTFCAGTIWYFEPLFMKCFSKSPMNEEGNEENQKTNGSHV